MGDCNAGEMCLCFNQDPRLQPYCGIDLTPIYNETVTNNTTNIWKCWGRCGMGFTDSPYKAIKQMHIATELVKGNRLDQQNPFHWSLVKVNYPGTKNYNPLMPYIYKYNPITKTIAGDMKGFVDDYLAIGANEHQCRQVVQTHTSKAQYLGIQDASKKEVQFLNDLELGLEQ